MLFFLFFFFPFLWGVGATPVVPRTFRVSENNNVMGMDQRVVVSVSGGETNGTTPYYIDKGGFVGMCVLDSIQFIKLPQSGTILRCADVNCFSFSRSVRQGDAIAMPSVTDWTTKQTRVFAYVPEEEYFNRYVFKTTNTISGSISPPNYRTYGVDRNLLHTCEDSACLDYVEYKYVYSCSSGAIKLPLLAGRDQFEVVGRISRPSLKVSSTGSVTGPASLASFFPQLGIQDGRYKVASMGAFVNSVYIDDPDGPESFVYDFQISYHVPLKEYSNESTITTVFLSASSIQSVWDRFNSELIVIEISEVYFVVISIIGKKPSTAKYFFNSISYETIQLADSPESFNWMRGVQLLLTFYIDSVDSLVVPVGWQPMNGFYIEQRIGFRGNPVNDSITVVSKWNSLETTYRLKHFEFSMDAMDEVDPGNSEICTMNPMVNFEIISRYRVDGTNSTRAPTTAPTLAPTPAPTSPPYVVIASIGEGSTPTMSNGSIDTEWRRDVASLCVRDTYYPPNTFDVDLDLPVGSAKTTMVFRIPVIDYNDYRVGKDSGILSWSSFHDLDGSVYGAAGIAFSDTNSTMGEIRAANCLGPPLETEIFHPTTTFCYVRKTFNSEYFYSAFAAVDNSGLLSPQDSMLSVIPAIRFETCDSPYPGFDLVAGIPNAECTSFGQESNAYSGEVLIRVRIPFTNAGTSDFTFFFTITKLPLDGTLYYCNNADCSNRDAVVQGVQREFPASVTLVDLGYIGDPDYFNHNIFNMKSYYDYQNSWLHKTRSPPGTVNCWQIVDAYGDTKDCKDAYFTAVSNNYISYSFSDLKGRPINDCPTVDDGGCPDYFHFTISLIDDPSFYENRYNIYVSNVFSGLRVSKPYILPDGRFFNRPGEQTPFGIGLGPDKDGDAWEITVTVFMKYIDYYDENYAPLQYGTTSANGDIYSTFIGTEGVDQFAKFNLCFGAEEQNGYPNECTGNILFVGLPSDMDDYFRGFYIRQFQSSVYQPTSLRISVSKGSWSYWFGIPRGMISIPGSYMDNAQDPQGGVALFVDGGSRVRNIPYQQIEVKFLALDAYRYVVFKKTNKAAETALKLLGNIGDWMDQWWAQLIMALVMCIPFFGEAFLILSGGVRTVAVGVRVATVAASTMDFAGAAASKLVDYTIMMIGKIVNALRVLLGYARQFLAFGLKKLSGFISRIVSKLKSIRPLKKPPRVGSVVKARPPAGTRGAFNSLFKKNYFKSLRSKFKKPKTRTSKNKQPTSTKTTKTKKPKKTKEQKKKERDEAKKKKQEEKKKRDDAKKKEREKSKRPNARPTGPTRRPISRSPATRFPTYAPNRNPNKAPRKKPKYRQRNKKSKFAKFGNFVAGLMSNLFGLFLYVIFGAIAIVGWIATFVGNNLFTPGPVYSGPHEKFLVESGLLKPGEYAELLRTYRVRTTTPVNIRDSVVAIV